MARPWTEEERARLRDMGALHMTSRAIAEYLGRSVKAVRQMFKHLRIKRGKGRYAGGMFIWTDERIEILRQEIEDGFTADHAAQLIGVSPQACRAKARKLGWSFQAARRLKAAKAKPKPAPRPKPKIRLVPTPAPQKAWRLSAIAKCQWIEGRPTRDDTCKCMAPAIEGQSWCPEHRARVFRPPTEREKKIPFINSRRPYGGRKAA